MKFVIFGNSFQAKKSVHATKLFDLLKKRGAELFVDKDFYDFISLGQGIDVNIDGIIENDNFNADMVISMGGDGTFLKAASKVKDKNIPILGINTGRLGFLADISPEEMEEMIVEIYKGNYKVEDRTVLHLTSSNNELTCYPYALNEISISKRDSSSMIGIRTYINGAFLTTYQADGLLISTPTGSTAYSLSVGGPIIIPHSNVIAITPVAPHSLNVRPMVMPDDFEIEIQVESRNHNFLIGIDGRSEKCAEGAILKIKKADYNIKVVKRMNHIFFDTLHKKLNWGIDIRE